MSENIYYTVKLGQTKENPWAIKNGKSMENWSRKPRKSGTYLKISQISLEHLPREH